MKLVDFTHTHIQQATQLALSNYREACFHTPPLPSNIAIPNLSLFIENGLGVAALEGEKLIGYLCSVNPIENPFQMQGVVGAYSPLHAHGAELRERKEIYARMIQAAGEKWAKAGASNHAVVFYAHDSLALDQMAQYGFGCRTVDSITSLTRSGRPSLPLNTAIACSELPRSEFDCLLPYHNQLVRHFWQSPMFTCFKTASKEDFSKINQPPDVRYFTARENKKIIAYIKIEDTGETFVSGHPRMKNICGAYCLPEHRGKNATQTVLSHVMDTLSREGATHIGVDFESFNPTATGFWSKYFTPYTSGVVRRIDHCSSLSSCR